MAPKTRHDLSPAAPRPRPRSRRRIAVAAQAPPPPPSPALSRAGAPPTRDHARRPASDGARGSPRAVEVPAAAPVGARAVGGSPALCRAVAADAQERLAAVDVD